MVLHIVVGYYDCDFVRMIAFAINVAAVVPVLVAATLVQVVVPIAIRWLV